MKHSRSSAEWEIRNALVDWLRIEIPTARIIHELVAGGSRADVAAVTRDRVILFEIKSEKDTLSRLDRQMRDFAAYGHHAILVAHRKWFDATPYDNGRPRLAWPMPHENGVGIWCYPQPDEPPEASMYRWRLTDAMRVGMRQPHAARMLNLLWKQEALELGRRYAAPVHDRLNQGAVNDVLAWHLTGRQICEGVCAALRRRPFAEADAPIEVAA